MNILIVSCGSLPLPAVNGGAVEGLIDLYIEENERIYHDKIDVVSVELPKNNISITSKYKYTNYIYIKRIGKYNMKNIIYKILKKLFGYSENYFINSAIKKIKKSAKEYDIIICENTPNYCLVLKKYFNSKIILHLHNDLLHPEKKSYSSIISSCDKIIAVSNYIKNRVNCPSKCEVVYNGINLSLFNDRKKDKKDLSLIKKYNLKENDFIFLFVGRTVPEKGISELIDAFLLLNKKYNNIKLIVVGSPFFAKKVKSNFYNSLLNKANENIIFTGYISNNEIYKYYNISNVQVTPSIFEEPFGLTAIEALAMNKRIIVTNSGALPELISNKYGIIINKENLVNSLFNAMEQEYLKKYKNNIDLNELKKYSKEEFAKNLHNSLTTTWRENEKNWNYYSDR